jgi:hypothetical protein
MKHRTLLERLVFLDREFIASAYEAIRGEAPATQITKSEGMNAGATLLFTAGLSASETKTFAVSTVGMLSSLMEELTFYPALQNPPIADAAPSRLGWVEGELTLVKTVLKDQDGEQKGSETAFAIGTSTGLRLLLITSPQYFVSGIAALLGLNEVVLEHVSFPVRALVRVLPAADSFKHWVAVPLVIYESAHSEPCRVP